MRVTSWMLLVLPLAGATAGSIPAGSPPFHTSAPTTPYSQRSRDRTPAGLVALQSDRSPAAFSVRWIGQEGHDYVGPGNQIRPSDTQDIRIELENLDPRRDVVLVDVTGKGADEWMYNARSFAWAAELKRKKGSATAALFIEANRVETGRPFHVVVRYDDGTTVEADVRGGRADPNLRMPGAAIAARWIGQDGQDCAAKGPSVGPEGLQDVRIHLTGISTKVSLKFVRIEGPAGTRWEFGTNPNLASNAELVRDPKDQSQADLFFQPDRDLGDQQITLTVGYEYERLDRTTVVAGRCDPALRVAQRPLPELSEGAVAAAWRGQDGQSAGGPGDVHVVVTGLPVSPPIRGWALSDSSRGVWLEHGNDPALVPADPFAEPLVVKMGADRRSADLFFAPFRDVAKDTFTLRLVTADGRSAVVRIAGGGCDLSKWAPRPEPTQITANPGDDIQALANRYGTVVLSRGKYRLSRPLVLNRPVTLTSAGGATLVFDQDASAPPWPAAIKVHCSNTTLNGFAVRFAGPVRWNNEVSWGPAVIGITDNLDQGHDERKVNVAFTRLDLDIPPVENRGGWVDAMRLMRLVRAVSGVIEGNVLRGGPIEFFEGPWRIVDNTLDGTPAGTFSHGVFTGHVTHDLLVQGNRTRAVDPSGKTWRFLVLTGCSNNDVIERNIIEHFGARDDDTIPGSNEPEIILTEAYHLKYEGRAMALSSDGRLLRTGRCHGFPVRTGDAVSLLDGPARGQWRRVVQAIDPVTFLVEPSIPPGTETVSISAGFVEEIFQENLIDIRRGRNSDCLVLVGNHFGTRVIRNHLLGGGHAFRLTACPTESPMMWGWSHAPYLGGVIEGNVLEDSVGGGELGLEHDRRSVKSSLGRTYMAVRFRQNVVRWSEPFLRSMERAGARSPLAGVTIGYPPSDDPGELVVAAAGNRLELPAGRRTSPALLIRAADYNGQTIVNRRVMMSEDSSATVGGRRADGTDTGSRR